MLPRPATTRWSSSAAFRLVFLPAQARASIAASNSLPSGSGPSPCSNGSCSSACARDDLHEAETARIVEDDRRARRHVKHHMIVRAIVAARMMELARRRRFVVGDARGTSPTCPDASPAPRRTTRSASRYLARRPRPVTVCPRSRAAKSFGNGKRRSGRRLRPSRIAHPSITGCRPRRTVSTSGKFGHARRSPCGRDVIAPLRRGALWSRRRRPVDGSTGPDHPFRLQGRAARREAGAGRTTSSTRGAALRPDERPDVGRPAPGLEGRAGHRAQSAARRPRRSRCSTSPAAPATSPSAPPRPAAPASASPSATSTPTCWRSGASARAAAASRRPHDVRRGQCRGAAVPRSAASTPTRSPSASATCRASTPRCARPIAC